MTPKLVVCYDPAAAAAAHFLKLRPRTVALAGGNTPRALYGYLGRTSYSWQRTHLFFGDERCVPFTDPASNYRMFAESLRPAVAPHVHPMPAGACDADAYEAELRAFFGPGIPVFDLVILGLGEDGHTASLFPGDAALHERSRLVARVQRPDYDRLTLTLPVLSAARQAVFLVTGEGKRVALGALLRGADIPASRVAAGCITIFADSAAAAACERDGRPPYTGLTPP